MCSHHFLQVFTSVSLFNTDITVRVSPNYICGDAKTINYPRRRCIVIMNLRNSRGIAFSHVWRWRNRFMFRTDDFERLQVNVSRIDSSITQLNITERFFIFWKEMLTWGNLEINLVLTADTSLLIIFQNSWHMHKFRSDWCFLTQTTSAHLPF